MIEKLSEYRIKSRDGGAFINVECNTKIINTLVQKTNELVDTVNELQKDYDNVCVWVGEQKLKKPVDPYAEQRKWIGKLCKFWDDEDEGYVYEILIDIEDDGSDYPYKMTDVDSESWTMSYKHCEPVSEDLIYKGE